LAFDVTQSGFQRWWIFLHFLGVAAMLIGAVAEAASYLEYRHLSSALAEGRFVQVEGPVTNFVAGRSDGHPPESFCVGARCYSYGSGLATAGFSQVSQQGGPMRPDAYVRISEVDGKIARLEIAHAEARIPSR
jgi:hypothetical protein